MSDVSSSASATPSGTAPDAGDLNPAAGDIYTFSFFTDYNANGNHSNIYGQTISYGEGVNGTQPKFLFLVN